MSTREIQDVVHQLGVFMFRNGAVNEGMVVARYNITDARIEYYFIHTSKVNEYREAKKSHDATAHKRIGSMIDVNTIIRAQLFNKKKMTRLTVANKIFLILCAALIVLISLTVPHEGPNAKADKASKTAVKNNE